MRQGLFGRSLALYAGCHLLVDWACILLVTGPLRQGVSTHRDWLAVILLYNACAFAMQLPLGVLLDWRGTSRWAAGAGAGLVAAGWLLLPVPVLACVTAGLGNALFHLGGGREVLLRSEARAAPSGLFVSTGAVGVWLGVWCARIGRSGLLPPLCLLALASAALLLRSRNAAVGERFWPPARRSGGLLVSVALLTLTVVLRSWVGGQMDFPWKVGGLSLLAVLCAAGGKALGGVFGDRLGWSRFGTLTLLLSAVCFLPSFRLVPAGLAANLLFNGTMAVTLAALAKRLGSENSGAAFGLTTFALFLGTLPNPSWGASPGVLCGGALLSALLLWGGLRKGAEPP